MPKRSSRTGNTTSLGAQISRALAEREMRQNLRTIALFGLALAVVVLIFTVVFHLIMVFAEGERHSWLTGLYWTLTVMSTLGFGDITFESEAGRFFSVVVLVTGLLTLLVLFPYVLVRYFITPWIELRIQLRDAPPLGVPPGTAGHVILSRYDSIAAGLAGRLRSAGTPFFILEPDDETARRMGRSGLPVVLGEIDSGASYEALAADRAALIVANAEDTTNTNITLTVRQVAPEVPIAAIVEDDDAVDILELAGCTHVFPLKRQLGEHLAYRANAGGARAHVVGRYHDLLIAEFAVHNTPLVGKTLRETELRAATGASIVALWERGRLRPAGPEVRLTDESVPVVIGTEAQIAKLNEGLVIYDRADESVLVIGGGRVGRAAASALTRTGIAVHIVERDPTLRASLEQVATEVFTGDASDRRVLMEAGLETTPTVLLTTHDDAMNIYLAVFCRRLNPETRIVSRITHKRNIEAVHRAGADLVLSYDSLGIETILTVLHRRELFFLGGGLDLFSTPIPDKLAGRTLAESGVGARTGLSIIAVQADHRMTTNPTSSTVLEPGGDLLMLGSAEQRARFEELWGGA